MKILIAPNSMKGSLSAFDFADIVEKAFFNCSNEFSIQKVPVADGGDFTGELLKRIFQAKEVCLNVKGPLGDEVNSRYFVSERKAVIEMADASGMKLVDSKQLNPLKASSYGTGQLMADAILKGCNQIFMAIGGSATVDGGAGMLEAMGFRVFDENGKILTGNGGNLIAIRKIQTPEIPKNISIKIICDVDNPLLGKNGAAQVFGPQKGATHEMLPQLEAGLKNWSEILEKISGKKLANVSGAGAAGGIAIPLLAFYNGEIVPGADFILEQLGFEEQIKWADIVITGEGKIDSQTLNNKAPAAVANAARRFNKQVVAFGGSVQDATEVFDGIFSIVNEAMSLEDAMKNSKKLLFDFSLQFARLLKKLCINHEKQ
ncbi:MAG TPA: glycerate kinase [Draconibacterium sp.]|nr:glycerate kinase [Draconibacterium sp.]